MTVSKKYEGTCLSFTCIQHMIQHIHKGINILPSVHECMNAMYVVHCRTTSKINFSFFSSFYFYLLFIYYLGKKK